MPPANVPQRLHPRVFRLPTMRFGSIILAVVLLVVTGAIGFVTVERMKASRDLLLHTYYIRGLLKDLRSDIGEIHANFDLYQLSKDLKEVPQIERQAQEELLKVEELRRFTTDNPTQQQRLDQFSRVLDEDIKQLHVCVSGAGCKNPSSPAGSDFITEIAVRRRIMSGMLRNMESMEDDLLLDRLSTWDHLFERMAITLLGSFILALILVIYNINLLLREIERRKEQEEIEKNNAESYKMLSARILELQDVERRKIARELHDSVGQFLAGLKLNLSQLQHRESCGPAQGQMLLAEAIDLTDHAITEVRTISHLLHPPLLDELGFHSAARWYAEGFAKRSGIQVELHVAEIGERLPKEIELALFRVLQESLTNVHRHAKASRVGIDVECTSAEVVLVVCDDGKGVNRDVLLQFHSGHAGGIGLAGMRERLAELGGTLEVESNLKGTLIRATLPTRQYDATNVSAENISISPG